MTKTAVAEPPTPAADVAIEERFERAEIGRLYESPLNPRKTFKADQDAGLEASVREKGIIEPLVVREGAGGKLEIIAGARRKRAAARAGLTHVPVVIRAYTDAQAIEIMAIENGQRADVPPLEEAEGYKRLLFIEKTYTPALIAKKIGHDERYVHNRLRLLQLVDEVKHLLALGAIGVEHADVLSKLAPSDQKRAIHRGNGGLWQPQDGLKFEEPAREGSTGYDRIKPVTARELREWVAEHVRLDIHQVAKIAPLDFGEAAARVTAAETEGKGKTPIPITFSYMCPAGASDPQERTYGQNAWKKAENTDGQPTCDYARLGVVVAGEHYSDTFLVCVNRDKCLVHWKDSVKAREQSAAARAKGDGKKAAKIEKKAATKQESDYDRKQREERAKKAAWDPIATPLIADVVAQVKAAKALTPQQAKVIQKQHHGELWMREAFEILGATWFKNLPAALLLACVTTFQYNGWNAKKSGFQTFVDDVAKPLGLDVKRLEAIRDKHAPKADLKAAAPATKKAAKK